MHKDKLFTSMSLKYKGCAVVFQEVPDEISLAFNITGCPWRCEGCHSKHLWTNDGQLLVDNFKNEIDNHPGITCVCFMGGEWDLNELIALADWAHKFGLKTCLYCGPHLLNEENVLNSFDYIKTGFYDEEKGPLSSPTTNQRFYKINKDRTVDKTISICKRSAAA